MFIETVPNRTSPPLIAGLKGLLKGGVAIPTAPGAASDAGLRIERSLPHGHVAAGLGMLRKIKLDRLLLSTAKGRGLATFLRLDGRTDRRPIAGVALEAGVRARHQRPDSEQQPGRGSLARRGGGARGLRGARLVARAAAARRERAGAAASEERDAGALRRQLVLSGGPQMPAGAARLQPRPSAGP